VCGGCLGLDSTRCSDDRVVSGTCSRAAGAAALPAGARGVQPPRFALVAAARRPPQRPRRRLHRPVQGGLAYVHFFFYRVYLVFFHRVSTGRDSATGQPCPVRDLPSSGTDFCDYFLSSCYPIQSNRYSMDLILRTHGNSHESLLANLALFYRDLPSFGTKFRGIDRFFLLKL